MRLLFIVVIVLVKVYKGSDACVTVGFRQKCINSIPIFGTKSQKVVFISSHKATNKLTDYYYPAKTYNQKATQSRLSIPVRSKS